MTQKLGLVIILGYAALGLAACGDSAGSYSPRPPDDSSGPPNNPPQEVGAVTVQIVTTSGTPIPEFRVGLGTSIDYRDALTDTEGRARFAEVPTGNASVDVGGSGFHWAYRDIVVNEDETTELTLAVVHSTEATPIVIAIDARRSDNGRRLTVDVDLAVLGPDGLAIPTFTSADFWVSGSDCGFAWCVMDESGLPLANGGYGAELDSGNFSWHEPSFDSVASTATALLIERSAVIADYDDRNVGTTSVHGFLDSVTAPDTVAVASYGGTPASPTFTTYGAFTSDGSLFHEDVDALASLDAGGNPMFAGLADMLSWSAVQTTAEPKSIVLLSGGWSWPDDDCGNSWACRHEHIVTIVSSSRESGIPIVAIGGSEPAADIAARTGGSYVAVRYPEQYSVVLENLKPIVLRQLGFNRFRVVLTGQLDAFDTGRKVWAYASVRMTRDTSVYFPIVIPIP